MFNIGTSYLDHEELWWGGQCEHESTENGCHLVQYFYWCSEDKRDPAEEGGWVGEVTESNVGKRSEGR